MKETQALIRIHRDDNVAVAVRPLSKGETLNAAEVRFTAAEDIPAGHKAALKPIEKGDLVIKYGCPIGIAAAPIPEGAHVHTHNIRTLLSETPEYHYHPLLPEPGREAIQIARDSVPVISAYKRTDGQTGIRNEIWIIPTVGCVNNTASALARWGSGEFARGSIDGVYAWTHPYGCSQMGRDHETTRTILADLAKHPNAGAVLVIALGCENNTVRGFKEALGSYAGDSNRIAFLVAQDEEDEIAAGKKLLTALAVHAGKAAREPVNLSELIIGMKCGGSDGFSGITANALTGQICDLITGLGGRAILTEVPEMFGAEQILMDRCESREVFDKTVSLIQDFKEYYRSHNQVVYENPSPGNKAGGISTLEDKSCGCVQKGGKAVIRGVYRYGERVAETPGSGLVLLEGPGNDIVSETAMTAAGAQIILFTTGRGTPLGAPVPTVKIASNSDIARKKKGWIDFDAGRMLTEDAKTVRTDLLRLIIEVASGVQKTRNELNDYREIAIFKNGVTL
jgi:altronate hydrolase